MKVEDALRAALIADPTVAAIVGSRVYPIDDVKQGLEVAHVSYQRVPGGTGGRTLEDDEDVLLEVRTQINCLDVTYDGMTRLVIAARAVFARGFAADGIARATPTAWGAFPKDREAKLYSASFDVLCRLLAAEAA